MRCLGTMAPRTKRFLLLLRTPSTTKEPLMNTRTQQISPLRNALRKAGLARTGAMLALALGAAQAGAVTYTVPLNFTINLAAPVCSLTVGSVTADATTPTPATGVTVNLTPTALAVSASPIAILNGIPGTTSIASNAFPAVAWMSETGRYLNSPPSASVTCTAGTPITARLSKASSATNASSPGNSFMAGAPGAGQSGTLPIGMLMGIASFAGATGAAGSSAATTINAQQPALSGTATGSAQTLALTAALYATGTTALSSSYAGLWTYSFNVHLDF